jgi:hypothetical protein
MNEMLIMTIAGPIAFVMTIAAILSAAVGWSFVFSLLIAAGSSVAYVIGGSVVDHVLRRRQRRWEDRAGQIAQRPIQCRSWASSRVRTSSRLVTESSSFSHQKQQPWSV